MDNFELNSSVESITGIQYDRGKNYYKELRTEQLAKRFDEIKFEIQLLEKEENKIPFKKFRLKVLKEEQRLLTEYATSDFKLRYSSASMERKLDSLYDNIQSLEKDYQKQVELFSNATKEKKKYSSYIKSNKIRNKIIELNAKMGLVKSEQLMGTINDFNSINQYYKFKATTNIIDNKVKDVASSVKEGVKNTYIRVSKSDTVSRLKVLVGKLKDTPRTLTLQTNQKELSNQLS